MGLVGPRPEREYFYNQFKNYIEGFEYRLSVKPGLTGLAQVSGGYDLLQLVPVHWETPHR